jgi:hypothetical protein
MIATLFSLSTLFTSTLGLFPFLAKGTAISSDKPQHPYYVNTSQGASASIVGGAA